MRSEMGGGAASSHSPCGFLFCVPHPSNSASYHSISSSRFSTRFSSTIVQHLFRLKTFISQGVYSLSPVATRSRDVSAPSGLRWRQKVLSFGNFGNCAKPISMHDTPITLPACPSGLEHAQSHLKMHTSGGRAAKHAAYLATVKHISRVGEALRLCSNLVESGSLSPLKKPGWVEHRMVVNKDREVGLSLHLFVYSRRFAT